MQEPKYKVRFDTKPELEQPTLFISAEVTRNQDGLIPLTETGAVTRVPLGNVQAIGMGAGSSISSTVTQKPKTLIVRYVEEGGQPETKVIQIEDSSDGDEAPIPSLFLSPLESRDADGPVTPNVGSEVTVVDGRAWGNLTTQTSNRVTLPNDGYVAGDEYTIFVRFRPSNGPAQWVFHINQASGTYFGKQNSNSQGVSSWTVYHGGSASSRTDVRLVDDEWCTITSRYDAPIHTTFLNGAHRRDSARSSANFGSADLVIMGATNNPATVEGVVIFPSAISDEDIERIGSIEEPWTWSNIVKEFDSFALGNSAKLSFNDTILKIDASSDVTILSVVAYDNLLDPTHLEDISNLPLNTLGWTQHVIETPIQGVRISWDIDLNENLGVPTRIEAFHNGSIVSLVEEPTNFYGVFRLGSRILPQPELKGSFVIEGASLLDLLGVRVCTEEREFRWSTNRPKPPFLHASPAKVFSRFDEDVEIGLTKLIPTRRSGELAWRVSNE